MKDITRWAIICGSYINAWSIIESLRAIDWAGKIVCVVAQEHEQTLVQLSKGIEIWRLNFTKPEELFCILSEKIPAQDEKVLFFTSEQFHEGLRSAAELLPNCRFWAGNLANLEVILDRLSFYRFIEKGGFADVPRTLESNQDPWQHFKGPFFLRIRKSWQGLKRRRGVVLIESPEHLQEISNELIEAGINQNEWCYQEVLSLDAHHNVSICGWYEPKHMRYFATCKIMQHPGRMGNGDVVSLVDSPSGLFESTQAILKTLDYAGPFELEYVYDQQSGKYKIIELNPRFWMQHGLLEQITDHELVRRYIGDFAQTGCHSQVDTFYWINSIYSLFRLLKGNWEILRYFRSETKVIVPPLSVSFRWLPLYLINKLHIPYL